MCKNTLHKRKTLVITISGANVQAVRKFTFKSIHGAKEKSICGTFFCKEKTLLITDEHYPSTKQFLICIFHDICLGQQYVTNYRLVDEEVQIHV